MRPRTAVLLMLLAVACVAVREPRPDHIALPDQTMQVVFVTTGGWSATAATVELWERDDRTWRQVGPPIAARVGRSGFGWGIGLHAIGDGPQKREGDGRAPAGVFPLGPVFGSFDLPPVGISMPYRAATERDYFVDDPASADYDTWQTIAHDEPNAPEARWRSFERMRRDDAQYDLGCVVGHNPEHVPGRGSAIFLHVWQDIETPTSGCTAMAMGDLLRLLRWLDPAARPLLVQGPRSVFGG